MKRLFLLLSIAAVGLVFSTKLSAQSNGCDGNYIFYGNGGEITLPFEYPKSPPGFPDKLYEYKESWKIVEYSKNLWARKLGLGKISVTGGYGPFKIEYVVTQSVDGLPGIEWGRFTICGFIYNNEDLSPF